MTSIDMITIQELLRDPQYRDYFKKVPKLPAHYTPENLPWKLIIMKKGENVWRTKRYGTYAEAFGGLKKVLPIIDNAAINCPALSFMPPLKTYRIKGKFIGNTKRPLLKTVVWQPRITADMEPHNWCPFCRRPTVFRMAVRAVSKKNSPFAPVMSEPQLRCSICGAGERIINLRHPELHQQWDSNRPKVA